MIRYVAFLRAVNVGGHTVKMGALRALFDGLGYTRVETVLASGNVLFESPSEDASALERDIEAALSAALGYEVVTFVRTVAEVAAIAAADPFPGFAPAAGEGTLYVLLMRERPPDAAARALDALTPEGDRTRVIGREGYWVVRGLVSQSPVTGAALERTLGQPLTMRNIATLRRIAARLG